MMDSAVASMKQRDERRKSRAEALGQSATRIVFRIRALYGKTTIKSLKTFNESSVEQSDSKRVNDREIVMNRQQWIEFCDDEQVSNLMADLNVSLIGMLAVFDQVANENSGTAALPEIMVCLLDMHGDVSRADVVALSREIGRVQKEIKSVVAQIIKSQKESLEPEKATKNKKSHT